nr:DUF4974 domain-containing protein [Pedobacter panaciterrae]
MQNYLTCRPWVTGKNIFNLIGTIQFSHRNNKDQLKRMKSEEQIKKIVELIGRQIRGELNATDERDLEIWIAESETNKIMFNQLTDPAYRQTELMEMKGFTSAPAAFANFMEKYGERNLKEDKTYIRPKPEPERKRDYEFLKYGTTAIILVALSIGFFIYLNNKELLENNAGSKVSLSTGSERLRNSDQPFVLKPGLQPVAENEVDDIYGTYIKEGAIWKQDFFSFDKETLESLMQKIASWYDVDVIFADDNVGKTLYTGSASRFSNITSLLDKLERTGPAKFKIEGRIILVQLQP